MADLRIGPRLTIPGDELAEAFVRSSGPGGQNVNKVASKVELRWSLATSRAVTPADRAWLRGRLAGQLTTDGELVVTASESRDQSRNRVVARDKLAALLRQALVRPRRRVASRPTRGSIERRLGSKKRKGERKRSRTRPDE